MKGRTSMKARLGIATAVVVGGGAIGVAAVAAGGHSGTASPSAESAAFQISQFHHTMSAGTALSTAMNELQRSPSSAMTTLAKMAPMRDFTQVWAGSRHHRTQLAAQRGIVELATKNFLVVKSSNGALHLWWLKGTKFENVSSSTTGMVAMTGNNTAATAAMVSNNITPAAVTMAGSTTAVSQMTAPVAKPTTITIVTGDETITITITPSTATVTTPTASPSATVSSTATATPTATASVSPTATASVSPTATASVSPTATATVAATPSATSTAVKTTQPVWTRTDGVARGDMVMVTGERVHGQLIAKLVLFSASTTTTTTTTPTATPSVSTSTTVKPTSTATTTATPTVEPTTSAGQFSGKNS
jgi:hypothetical protein